MNADHRLPLHQGADYWRSRAKEARAQAEEAQGADGRRALQRFAAIYDELAQQAERQARATNLPG